MVSNKEFLQAIFGENHIYAHVTSFPDDPSAIPNDRRGICWAGGLYKEYNLTPGENQFYTVSLFAPDKETGCAFRRKANFAGCYVIGLDDVKEKLPLEQVERLPKPSIVLKSSLHSEQWLYILNTPETSQARLNNLHDQLIANGLAPDGIDPGQKGVTRYLRMPEGFNTKAKRIEENNGTAPQCEITVWQPERRYTMEQLAEPFDVDLDKPRADTTLNTTTNLPDHPVLKYLNTKSNKGNGIFDITCPWLDEHTGRQDDGAVIFTNEDRSFGFKCHHGHCQDKNVNDVLTTLGIKHSNIRQEYMDYKGQHHLDGLEKINKPMSLPTIDFMTGEVINKAKPSERKFDLISAAELTSTPKLNDWLIKDYFECDNVALMFGNPASGKSLIALDMAFCISEGLNWNSKKTKQGSVVYIAGEGFSGLSRRIKALETKYGRQSKNLYLSNSSASLTSAESASDVMQAIQLLPEEPVLIVIDTLHRNLGAGDENSAKDISIFLNNLDTYLRHDKVTIVIVHHSGHGATNRARGSSAINAGVDLEYSIKKDTSGITMKNTKAKDINPPPSIGFALTTVALDWADEDGAPQTSVVLKVIDAMGTTSDVVLKSHERDVLSALKAELASTLHRPGDLKPHPKHSIDSAIHIEQWRSAAYKKIDLTNKSSLRQAFNRAKNKLIEIGEVICDEDFFWIPERDTVTPLKGV